MNDDNEIRIYKLSQSSLFNADNNGKININSQSFNDDFEYNSVLSDAREKGLAFIIDGDEPTEPELLEIKKIYDKVGAVKIFRKRSKDTKYLSGRNTFNKDVSIRPSNFKGIGGTEIERDEIKHLKKSVCHYIVELIKS